MCTGKIHVDNLPACPAQEVTMGLPSQFIPSALAGDRQNVYEPGPVQSIERVVDRGFRETGHLSHEKQVKLLGIGMAHLLKGLQDSHALVRGFDAARH